MSYTINISLPKQLSNLAHEQIKQGYYESVSEVVRDALRRLLLPEVPTFQMSKKAQRVADKAYADYKAGKTKILRSVSDLDLL